MNLIKRLIVIALFFLLLAIIFFIWSINQKLEKIPKVTISFAGPEKTKTFLLEDYRISILNESDTELQNLSLKVILPENFYLYNPQNFSFNFDLKPNEQKFFDFSGAFLKGEGIFPIKVKLFSNKIDKDEVFQVNVIEEGVDLVYNFPPEIEPGNEFNFQITVKNNLDKILPLILKIPSVPGLSLFFNENQLNELNEKIDLQPGEKKIYNLSGSFEANTSLGRKEIKIFLIALKDKEPIFSRDFSIFINLIESPISISANLPPIVQNNQELNFNISLKNNSQKILDNSRLILELIPDYFVVNTIKLSSQGIAKLNESLLAEWSFERVPELVKILPNQQLSFSVKINLNLPKNYYNLEIPLKVVFENEKENLKKEEIFKLKVKGSVNVSRKIEWIGGEKSLKAQKSSLFKLTYEIFPEGEDLADFNLNFAFPYWVKATSTQGSIIANNFYFSQELIKNKQPLTIEIFLEVTPFLNQVGDNIIILQETNISGKLQFTDQKVNLVLPAIASDSKEIENFLPGRVSF